ncbi:MAG: PhzF family phenazine biosynthesis protein [Pseudomonadota bacterium]
MPRKFYTLDVFTNSAMTGNPLAVVLDSAGLDDATMQAIANEFNLSETVFVFPPDKIENRAFIRIFTSVRELPFAGHPTVGTAILLSHLDRSDDFVLEEKVGPVRCVISREGEVSAARFELPKRSERLALDIDLELLGGALGLPVAAFGFDDHLVGVWDAGVPYTLVPVKSLEYVKNIQINLEKLRQVEPIIDGNGGNPYVYCRGGDALDADFHARMFAPLHGTPEDPATGSAVASLSGLILQADMSDNESRSFKIEQGYEMGRPSQIGLDLERQNGIAARAGISGSAVIVSEGVLHI